MFTLGTKVVVRVTARTDEARTFWTNKLAAEIAVTTGGLTVAYAGTLPDGQKIGEWGFWGPTGEFEPSNRLEVGVPSLADAHALLRRIWPVVQDWLGKCEQEAVYVEIDGHASIYDAGEDYLPS